jgi:hypothetical protein
MTSFARATNALKSLSVLQGICWLACVGVFHGCHDLDNDTVITGELPEWGECDASLMPWEPRFAAMQEYADGSVILRFQSTGGGLDQDDYLYVLFGSEVDLAAGATVEIVPPADEATGTLSTGVIAFNESCADERGRSGILTGTVTFDAVRRERGEDIVGEMQVRVVDGRNPGVVYSEELRAEFRFGYRDYPPFRLFF